MARRRRSRVYWRNGDRLAPGAVRQHLNSLSNLYRRAASEGYVEAGFGEGGIEAAARGGIERAGEWVYRGV